jgi:hypothetical protein
MHCVRVLALCLNAQISQQFNIPVLQSPRITAVENATTQFNINSPSPIIFFSGINLDVGAHNIYFKLSTSADCSSYGNSSLSSGLGYVSHLPLSAIVVLLFAECL